MGHAALVLLTLNLNIAIYHITDYPYTPNHS